MSKQQQLRLIMIAGPTAVGKSDVGLALARQIHGEIINADSGQLYTPLSIGTAKPDLQTTDIPHHLFDVLDSPVNYTITQYRQSALAIAHAIHARQHMPIMVGGSSFYLASLLFPPTSAATTVVQNTFVKEDSQEKLWDQLHAIDPVRAQQIHPNDVYRIQRALDIWQQTGTKPSEYQPVYDPPCPYIFVICMRDRDELYNRINERTAYMIKHGWLEEVEPLLGTPWEPFLLHKKIIGYDDIILYLQGKLEITQQELIERIAQKTRNYAKRQMIFLRMLQKRLLQQSENQEQPQGHCIELNLTNTDIDLYSKQLSETINRLFES